MIGTRNRGFVRRTCRQRLTAYWKAFALRLGAIQTELFIALLYVGVFGPANLLLRALRRDLLTKRTRKSSYWVPHEPQPKTLERYRHQF
jgi:hypothetical protein